MAGQEKYLRLGKLATLREELGDCECKINRLLEEIRTGAYPLEGVEQVDAKALHQATAELEHEQARLLSLKRQIKDLEAA